MIKTVLAGVAILALVAGCGGTGIQPGATAPDETQLLPVDLPKDINQVEYPLDDYVPNAAQRDILHKARYELAKDCALKSGYRLPARDTGVLRGLKRDRYGLSNEADAQRWGYSTDRIEKEEDTPWESRLDDATSRVVAACTAQTKAPVEDVVADLERRAWNLAHADSRVRKAMTVWRDCVRAAGYRYDNPLGAAYSYWNDRRMAENPNPTAEQKRAGIPPSPAEVAAALTDIQCKNESGLLTTWVTADIAYQGVLIDQNYERLRQARAAFTEQVRTSQQVLAR